MFTNRNIVVAIAREDYKQRYMLRQRIEDAVLTIVMAFTVGSLGASIAKYVMVAHG